MTDQTYNRTDIMIEAHEAAAKCLGHALYKLISPT